MSNIKYFGFSKASSTIPVYGLFNQKDIQEDVKIETGKVHSFLRRYLILTQVLNQLKSLNMRVDERQKIKSGSGCWYCKKDNHDIIYIVLCSSNYPQRHIFAAINLLKDHLQKLGEYQTEPQATLKLHAKSVVAEICAKYENLKGIDKIAEIDDSIRSIRDSARESTTKVMNNAVQLEELQKKSQTLKSHAIQFSESATELERIMYWRNCKLKIVIVLIIVCLICFIVVPIVTK